MHSCRLVFVFLAVLLHLCPVLLASGDAFALFDADKDGSLSRNEFAGFVHKVESVLDPLFELPDKDGSHAEEEELLDVGGSLLSGSDFVSSTAKALVVILVTELGDKTFFIAAVLAMRHGRLVVYVGAMGALAAMHILSCIMGLALPSLLPRKYTHFASALLFLYFGCRLLKDAYEMVGEGPSEELQEVEEELINKKEGGGAEQDHNDDEEGDGGEKGTGGGGSGGDGSSKGKNMVQQYARPENLKVFTQAFTLTFFAEWGDRSQIATIALAASKNPYGVILGGLVGHAFCTGLAVIGGRMLASRISERTVAIVGGILFLIFGLHALVAEE